MLSIVALRLKKTDRRKGLDGRFWNQATKGIGMR